MKEHNAGSNGAALEVIVAIIIALVVCISIIEVLYLAF